ncbi:hypothetical protein J1N35_010007 [Gossypium stocksii]|uniref:Uncharacterized protein n=1 Tax=Gossypium stocksii TaxID=47602 RepID=A0A9D3VZP4_9ROSI|nr:hypothetical protein J1N35_010007 [Gossypium stocksii]
MRSALDEVCLKFCFVSNVVIWSNHQFTRLHIAFLHKQCGNQLFHVGVGANSFTCQKINGLGGISRMKKHRNVFILSGASGSSSELISSALAWTKSVGVREVVNQCAYLYWCSQNCDVKFRHIYRNADKVVDCMAKADGSIIEQLVILEDPPHYVRCWLEEGIKQSLMTDDNFH